MLAIDGRDWYEVIGIVPDRPATGFGASFLPHNVVYLSVLQHPVTSAELVVRQTPGRPGVSIPDAIVRSAVGPVEVHRVSVASLPPPRWRPWPGSAAGSGSKAGPWC